MQKLDGILDEVRLKAKHISVVDFLRSTTSGDIREHYNVIIETELFGLHRMIDRFKLAVCEAVCALNSPALNYGSIFPTEGRINPA
jgi:hypothetical protein